MDLFVYGTLLDGGLVWQLTRRRFRTQVAVLEGYRKVVPVDGYAYIVPDSHGRVEGHVLRDIDAASLRALDEYEDEGTLYLRRRVVALVDGCGLACMTYVGIPEAHQRAAH